MADWQLIEEGLKRGYSLNEVTDIIAKEEGVDPSYARERGFDSPAILRRLGYVKPEEVKPEKGFIGNVLDQAAHGVKTAYQGLLSAPGIYAGNPDAERIAGTIQAEQSHEKPKEMREAEAAFADVSKRQSDFESVYGKDSGYMDSIGKIMDMLVTTGKEIVTNPKGMAYEMASQSGNMVAPMVGAYAGGKTGAVTGALLGPKGAVAGGVVGAGAGGFAGSHVMEQSGEFRGKVAERLSELGLEPTAENVSAIFQDKAWLDKTLEETRDKATGTAVTDGVLAAIGGLAVNAPIRAAQKTARAQLGATATAKQVSDAASDILASQPKWQKVAPHLKAGAIGWGGEPISEAAGQQYGYGHIDYGDVGMEAFAAAGEGIGSVYAAAKGMRTNPTPPANVTPSPSITSAPTTDGAIKAFQDEVDSVTPRGSFGSMDDLAGLIESERSDLGKRRGLRAQQQQDARDMENEFNGLVKDEQIDQSYRLNDAQQQRDAERARDGGYDLALQQREEQQGRTVEQLAAASEAQGFGAEEPTAMQLAMQRAQQKALDNEFSGLLKQERASLNEMRANVKRVAGVPVEQISTPQLEEIAQSEAHPNTKMAAVAALNDRHDAIQQERERLMQLREARLAEQSQGETNGVQPHAANGQVAARGPVGGSNHVPGGGLDAAVGNVAGSGRINANPPHVAQGSRESVSVPNADSQANVRALTENAAKRQATQLTNQGYPTVAYPHPTQPGMWAIGSHAEAKSAPAKEQQAQQAQHAPVEPAADDVPVINVRQYTTRRKPASNTIAQAIINLGGISTSLKTDILGDASIKTRPGLFTTNGTGDLGEIAAMLSSEFGFYQIDLNDPTDNSGEKQLADLIARAVNGESILNEEAMTRAQQDEEFEQAKAEVNLQAQEIGIKPIRGKRTIDIVQSEINAILAEREEMSRQKKKAQLLLDEVAEQELIEAFDLAMQEYHDETAISRDESRVESARISTEESAQGDGDSVDQASPVAGRASPTEGGRGEAEVTPEFGLVGQTEEEAIAEEQARRDVGHHNLHSIHAVLLRAVESIIPDMQRFERVLGKSQWAGYAKKLINSNDVLKGFLSQTVVGDEAKFKIALAKAADSKALESIADRLRRAMPQPEAKEIGDFGEKIGAAREGQGAEVAPEFGLVGQTEAEARAEQGRLNQPEGLTKEQIDREATAPFSLHSDVMPPAEGPTGRTESMFTPDGRATKAAGDKPAEAVERPAREFIGTGDKLYSESGRALSPAPKIETGSARKTNASIKRMNAWLLDDARKEAEANGNDWQQTLLRGIDANKMQQPDLDTVNDILFGDPDGPQAKHRAPHDGSVETPKAAQSILKPLSEPTPLHPDRTSTIAAVRRGDLTPEDVAEAHPVEQENGKDSFTLERLNRDDNKTPYTIAEHSETIDKLNAGTLTVEEYKAAFARAIESREALAAEFQKMTKDAIMKTARLSVHYKNDTKDRIVKAAANETVEAFDIRESSTWAMGTDRFASLRNFVEGVTQADLDAYAAKRKAKIEEYVAGRQAMREGIDNPQTLEDFRNAIQVHKSDGKTFAEARMMLTPEQRATFDELTAEESRKTRNYRADQKAVVQVAAATTEGQIVQTKHTKTGEDLFVVKAAERVERDVYNQWNATAKKLGGWYSSFRGAGAVPGFQFKTMENAEAFLKYLGGDVSEAKAAVQERRDAFADDKSQSAVERLREMAERLDEKADEALGRDRKANTARRARFAAAAESAANGDKAMAATMRNIAQAIESGSAKFLDRVRQKMQIEMLNSLVSIAQWDYWRAKYPTYSEQERHKGEPAVPEVADYARFPQYTAFRSDLAKLGRQMLEIDGAKKIGQQLLSVVDDVTDAYLEFAKANLHKVSTFKHGDGQMAVFSSRDAAEKAIARSGYKGKAIVLPFKRGQNIIVQSPSFAKENGIWEGDGDKLITLNAEVGSAIVAKGKELGRKLDVPSSFGYVAEKQSRLRAMGIETPAEFRAMLREFIGMKQAPKAPDRVKELERAMAGKRNTDGLDFFPTPAGTVRAMLDAAEIEPGMSVLEPSAGMGHIADMIREEGVEPDVVEISGERRELLDAKGHNVVGSDFMEVAGEYDRILMNPPFGDRRDAEHVRHAFDLLASNGRLVAIMGEGVFFGQDKKARQFREWLESVGGTSEKLDEGTFLDPSLPVNTGVNARLVVIDKRSSDVVMFSRGRGNLRSRPRGEITHETQRLEKEINRDLSRQGKEAIWATGFITRSAVPDNARRLVAAVEKLFGVRVEFVQVGDERANIFNGVFLGGNTLFVNVDSSSPVSTVIGHEFLHFLKESNPDLYAKAESVLLALANAKKFAAAATKHQPAMNAGEEVIADTFGDQFSNPEFWEEMANRVEPSLFMRIRAAFTRFMGKLLGEIKAMGTTHKTDALYSDLDAVRDAVLSATVGAAKGRKLATPSWSNLHARFMTAWHGSPHDHDGFDSSKIGTGEGAQAGSETGSTINTIAAAIRKTYGDVLDKLQAKNLITLTQTQDEAIEAAAKARAEKTGRPLAEVRNELLARVRNARGDGGIDIVDARTIDIKRSADGSIQGFYDPQSGQSFLIADGLTNDAAPGVLAHEVGIHMAADKAASKNMERLFKRAGVLVRGHAGAFFDRVRSRMKDAGETSNEEAAAYIAEEWENNRKGAPESVASYVREWIAAVKAWLAGKGVSVDLLKLGPADIAAIARANVRQMAQGAEARAGNGTVRRSSASPTESEVRGLMAQYASTEGAPSEAQIRAAVRDYRDTERAYGGQATYEKAKAAGKTKLGYRQWVQVRTQAFKQWFGDWENDPANASKVIDPETGEPMVVYHGTASDFSAFSKNAESKHIPLPGFYFALDAGYANRFAESAGKESRDSDGYITGYEGSNVMVTYLSLKNPTKIDLGDDAFGGVMTSAKEVDKLLNKAKLDGHDGAIITGWADGSGPIQFVAFSPTQIKSATGNVGTFGESDDIRFSRAGNEGPIWSAPEMSRTDNIIYTMQDKNIDLKRVQQAIKSTAGEIRDDIDAYLQEELFHGRAAKITEEFLDKEVNPLISLMRASNVSMDELETFLWARHAKERNAQIAKINDEMPDGGSGLTNKQADDLMGGKDVTIGDKTIAGVKPARKKLLSDLAGRVDVITKGSRALLERYGLESAETLNAWDGAYQHYVPLHREDTDSHLAGMGTGQGYSVKGSSSKRATGSFRPVENILANLVLQRERIITRGEKNRVAQALHGLAKEMPNADLWEVDVKPTIRTTAMIGGREQVVDAVDPNFRNKPNVVFARFNGEDRFVVFNEHNERALRMAEALKNLDADDISHLLGEVSRWTRYFASINTQYNPIFGVTNLVRDVQTGLLNLKSTPLDGKQKEMAGNLVHALPAVFKALRADRKGQAATGTWAQLWEEFQEVGGQTGYRDMFRNSHERAEALQNALDPTWWQKTWWGKAATVGGILAAPEQVFVEKVGKPFMELLSDYNTMMENGIRLSAYKLALDSGMTKERAASLAKNLTVNFNRKGQAGRQVGAMYAFFNASVQGTARMAETLNHGAKPGELLGKAGKQIIYGGLMLGALQAMLLLAAGFDDEEPPEFVRDRNIIIPTGNGKYISIPLPLGFHVLPTIGRISVEFTAGGFKKPGEHLVHVMDVLLDSFNPIGNAGMSMQTLAPTVLDPVAALTENKDWSGRQIARQDFSKLNPTPGYTRAKDTASSLSRGLAYALNYLSGGGEYGIGIVSPTPDQIEYLIGQVTGGVGRELGKVATTGEAIGTGEDLPPHKIPLVGRFYGDTTGQSSEASKFYGTLEKLAEHKGALDRMKDAHDSESYRDYLRKHPESRLYGRAASVQREVANLRKLKRQLLDRGADRAKIRQVEDRMKAVMARFNQSASEHIRNQQ